MGISSEVRLAAMIPARRATSSGSPLGFFGSAFSTAGVMLHEGAGLGLAPGGGLAGDIDHAGAARVVVVGELFRHAEVLSYMVEQWSVVGGQWSVMDQ